MKNTYQSIIFSFFTLYVLFSGNVFGQGQANVWIGPTRVGLNFNSGSPTSFVSGAANGVIDATNREGEGCSSIADSLGNLLFYTEGVNIYDKTHAVMSNGSGLLGNISSTQSAVIVPCPANPTRFYYVFCAPPEEASAAPGGSSTSSDGITYSIVDMNGNGGLGAVTTKNVRVTPAGENATEGLTAVPNFAGNGFWLIAHRAGDKTSATPAYNKFYIYGVTKTGITASTGVITSWNDQSANAGTGIGGVPASTSGNGQVIIKSNSCFNKLAMTFFAKNSLVEIYNFDNSTGAISLANSVTNVINNQVYGVEFSPNGKMLYVTILETNHRLYQFDISSGVDATINAAAAKTEWTPTGAASLRWGQLQLGPDGKIYMSHHVNWGVLGSGAPNASIGVINSPNTAGTSCNFVEQQITTTSTATYGGTGTKHGLPQFYKGFIAGVASVKPGAGLNSLDEVCVGEAADFDATYTQSGINWKWNIDANVGPNTINEYFTQNITHTYATAGTYDVVLQLQDATCLYNVTEKTKIIVNPVYTPTGTVTCGSPIKGNVTSTVDATKKYVWYSDAALTKPIAIGTSNVTLPIGGAGNVYLRIENNASSSSASSVLRNSGSKSSEYTAASFNSLFTINKPITLTSFQWNTADQDWPCPGTPNVRTITISVVENVSSAVMWSNARSIDLCNASTTFTESPNLILPTGTYKVVWSVSGGSTMFFADFNSSSPASDANVNISSNPQYLANFNYSVTTITVPAPLLPCSKTATIAFNCPLPVTWLDFTARRLSNGSSVVLNWSTASEQNTKVYYIQRSLDGTNFETVDQLNAAGNSNAIKPYEYTDFNAPAGNVYYRLLQQDIDGASSYSKIVYVNGIGSLNLSLVPNPGNGSFAIVGLSGDVKLNVTVYSITGQSIYNTTVYSGEVINLDNVAKGFYIVKIISGSTEQSIRYINQ